MKNNHINSIDPNKTSSASSQTRLTFVQPQTTIDLINRKHIFRIGEPLFFRCRICGGKAKQSRHGPENSTRAITAPFVVFLVGKFNAHDTKPTQFAEWLSNYFRQTNGYHTRRFRLFFLQFSARLLFGCQYKSDYFFFNTTKFHYDFEVNNTIIKGKNLIWKTAPNFY